MALDFGGRDPRTGTKMRREEARGRLRDLAIARGKYGRMREREYKEQLMREQERLRRELEEQRAEQKRAQKAGLKAQLMGLGGSLVGAGVGTLAGPGMGTMIGSQIGGALGQGLGAATMAGDHPGMAAQNLSTMQSQLGSAMGMGAMAMGRGMGGAAGGVNPASATFKGSVPGASQPGCLGAAPINPAVAGVDYGYTPPAATPLPAAANPFDPYGYGAIG